MEYAWNIFDIVVTVIVVGQIIAGLLLGIAEVIARKRNSKYYPAIKKFCDNLSSWVPITVYVYAFVDAVATTK